jgi:hypothetical protein
VFTPALRLPEKQATAWVTETTVSATRSWLNTLSLADSNLAARELYRSLYTLNRIDLKAKTRENILELYRNPINTVAAAIQSHLGQQTFPLTENQRHLTEIVRELLREMAIGYKTVVAESHNSWRQRLFRKTIATPIERGLRYLGEHLLHCYHVYTPYPPLIWLEVHELYRYAQQLALEQVPVEISMREGAGTTTINERYSQICLLGSCNPYRLPQGEAKKVHKFLYRWSGKAMLLKPDGSIPKPGWFFIDLLRDGPPVMLQQPVAAGMAKRVRVLDASLLNEKIRSFVRQLEKGIPAAELNIGTECLDSACLEMFRRLLDSWDEVGRRQHNRSQGKGLVSACIGIESAHFFADGQRPFLPPEGHGEPDSVFAVSDSGDDNQQYIDFDVPFDVDGVSAVKSTAESASRKHDFHITRWQIVDQSANGMLLRSRESPGMQIRVGDMLGIQFDASADGVWWPAVIRRFRGDLHGIVEIGIELLASHYEPVALRAANGSAVYVPALLLSALETPENRRPQSLVFSRGAFRDLAGMQLTIYSGEQARQIRPLKLVERTGSFEQIFFADVLNSES